MFWQIFVKMSHFGDPIYLENIFHIYRWIFLVKALLLSAHMTIFWVMFLTTKVGNFATIVLITHFFLWVHILIFDLTYSNKMFQTLSMIYHKISMKKSLVFWENAKKFPNAFFEVAVMGVKNGRSEIFYRGWNFTNLNFR